MNAAAIEFSPAVTNTDGPLRLEGITLAQCEAMIAELQGLARTLAAA